MGSLSPIAVALAIIFLVALVGLVVAHFRDRGTFAGYEDIAREAAHIAKTLKGELFRDGDDLVVSGNFFRMPTVIRFSYAENTPGMNLSMSAPSTFTLSVVPKGAQATEGRVLVRTPDDMFDARFTSRSDHPNQAKIFLGGKTVNAALHKLLCSQKTFFTMTTGSMELSELVIPQPYTAHHVLDHLESMRRLSAAAAEMPGAHTVSIKQIEKDRAIVGRLAIAVGIITAILVVVGATRNLATSAKAGAPVDATSAVAQRGIMPVDAPFIPRAAQYRAATEDDLTAGAANWLRQSGEVHAGRIPGDYSGTKLPRDVAYLLVSDSGTRRVVLLASGRNLLDSEYSATAFAVRVPHDNISGIHFKGPKPPDPDGDALLLVRNADDGSSSVLVYLSSGRLVSGAPTDYQQISLD